MLVVVTVLTSSDRCDLWKTLQIEEGRFTTDDNLLPQTLGHIQHEYEVISYMNGEKNLHTTCTELGDEFPAIFKLSSTQTLEDTDMDQEMKRPMTETEEKRCKAGIPRETITEDRIWNKRPDGLTIKMPISEKVGEFVIVEFKRMSDVIDQYFTRSKRVAVVQCVSIKSVLEQTKDGM